MSKEICDTEAELSQAIIAAMRAGLTVTFNPMTGYAAMSIVVSGPCPAAGSAAIASLKCISGQVLESVLPEVVIRKELQQACREVLHTSEPSKPQTPKHVEYIQCPRCIGWENMPGSQLSGCMLCSGTRTLLIQG